MNGDVFVFCGATNNHGILNSIEKLSGAARNRVQLGNWNIINVKESVLIPRWNPAVCALNSQEIVVMGGLADIDDVVSCLGDVVLFNVKIG